MRQTNFRLIRFDVGIASKDEETGKNGFTVVALTSNHLMELHYIEDITCLLYTSPSPRDLSTSRMPSSA